MLTRLQLMLAELRFYGAELEFEHMLDESGLRHNLRIEFPDRFTFVLEYRKEPTALLFNCLEALKQEESTRERRVDSRECLRYLDVILRNAERCGLEKDVLDLIKWAPRTLKTLCNYFENAVSCCPEHPEVPRPALLLRWGKNEARMDIADDVEPALTDSQWIYRALLRQHANKHAALVELKHLEERKQHGS